MTLHRPANVDHPAVLERLLRVLTELSMALPSVFRCIHAPKQSSNRPAGLLDTSRLLCLPPLGYLEMLGLLARACLVLTDSGAFRKRLRRWGCPA